MELVRTQKSYILYYFSGNFYINGKQYIKNKCKDLIHVDVLPVCKI